MATGQGTLTFDFGSAPGTNIASVLGVVATGISSTSKLEIYLIGTESTATHNAFEHRIIELGGFSMKATSIGSVTFDAQAASLLRLTGQISAHFVWAD